MQQILLVFGAVLSLSSVASAQLSVSYNQSNLPFVGVQYGFLEGRLLPEARVGIDNFVEDVSLELAVNYAFFQKDRYGAYAGLNGRFVEPIPGLGAQVGVTAAPFDSDRVTFRVETALIGIGGEFEDEVALRGSAGLLIRITDR